jgi:histone H3/H4
MKEKTVTISFRISENAFKALQEDAKKHNVSINTLANQLFVTYAEYDRYLSKFHMIKLSAPTFKRILNASTDDAIVEAARAAGASVPVSFILAQKGEYTLGNAIDYLRTMGAHANLFDFSESVGSGSSTITLTHDLGSHGSVFLANYVESLLKPLGTEFKVLKFPDAITIRL